MSKYVYSLFFLISFTMVAQKTDYYEKKGVAIEGYDVVAYFDGNAKKGAKELSAMHDGTKFLFSSEENLKRFKQNPENYLPQYGGYCAYAVALKGKKVKVDPKTYEIRDGKLYLFYNAWGTNTLTLWQEEGAETLKEKADANWLKLHH